jgi:hypothetical protein
MDVSLSGSQFLHSNATYLGRPLHASEQPPRKSARAESDYDVAELERCDRDIVSTRVEGAVEVRAVLRKKAANDLGFIGEGVGRDETDEGGQGREDGGRELRVVGLLKGKWLAIESSLLWRVDVCESRECLP